MNFDVVYEKYVNGTATEEEKAYVEAEIAKAKKLSAIIDNMENHRVIAPAKVEDVQKATKTMKKKFGLRAVLISLAVLLLVVISIAVSIHGYTRIKATDRAEFSKTECFELAKKAVNDHADTVSTDLVVTEWEKDIRYPDGKLSRAVYVYEIEIRKGYKEYEVEVNTSTGKATIVDVDD